MVVKPKPLVLCILDGWGHSENPEHNAIMAASTPNFDRLLKEHPYSFVETSGLDVGLPKGQMGNSEVGHMTIGSGRIMMQDLPRIDQAIENGSLEKNAELEGFINKIKASKGSCHLLGLCSDGGVHAHIEHIMELAKTISAKGLEVNIHVITDGRDTPPNSARGFIDKIEEARKGNGKIKICTVSGRYYAMDRDKRWERMQIAYDAMVYGKAENVKSAREALEKSHAAGKTDEFILPVIVDGYGGMKDGDGVIIANFRADRARQIMEALLDDKFTGFVRQKIIKFSAALGMVEYSETLNKFMGAMFRKESLDNILPEIIAVRGMKQLRIAETEKYAHVTFFFSGGREKEFDGEERILVPSPKVATYDMQPEMAAKEVTEKLLAAIAADKYDLVVVNFANTDMVGHTGSMEAAVKAVETVDSCIGMVADAVVKKGGVMLITADHGNAEEMLDAGGNPHTQHTLNAVPLIAVGAGKIKMKNGRLSDIAPTILQLMNIDKPKEMNGSSLINQI